MNPFLIFVCFLGGMVSVAFVVSRITGARAQFIESFPLEPGERTLWEDMEADAWPVLTHRALIQTYPRLRRGAVRVTNQRILCGTRALFSQKHMIEHVLYPSDRPFPDAANGITGGTLKNAYKTLVFERASLARNSDKYAFVEVMLDQRIASSLNLIKFRIYSEKLDLFALPD